MSGKGRFCGALRASTLLEAVVASVVFLLVFGVAMESAVKLRRLAFPPWTAVEVAVNACRDSLRIALPKGADVPLSEVGGMEAEELPSRRSFHWKYPWGCIDGHATAVNWAESVWDVRLEVTLSSGQKVGYRFLAL